jgi:hypothetical protein
MLVVSTCFYCNINAQKAVLIAQKGDVVIELQMLNQSGMARLTLAFIVFDQKSKLKHIYSKQIHGSGKARRREIEYTADYHYDELGRVIKENVFKTDGDSTSLIRYGLYTYVANGHDFRAYDAVTDSLLTEVVTRTENNIRTTKRLFDHAPFLDDDDDLGDAPGYYTWEINSTGRAISLKRSCDVTVCSYQYIYSPGEIAVLSDDALIYTLMYDDKNRLVNLNYPGERPLGTRYKYHRKTGLLKMVVVAGQVSGSKGERIATGRKFKLHKEFSPDLSNISIDAINNELIHLFGKVPGQLYDDSRYYMFLQ